MSDLILGGGMDGKPYRWPCQLCHRVYEGRWKACGVGSWSATIFCPTCQGDHDSVRANGGRNPLPMARTMPMTFKQKARAFLRGFVRGYFMPWTVFTDRRKR